MRIQKKAERTIRIMNSLWKEYNTHQEPALRTSIMNVFVRCQHFLSNHQIAYHQDPTTGKWELLGQSHQSRAGDESRGPTHEV